MAAGHKLLSATCKQWFHTCKTHLPALPSSQNAWFSCCRISRSLDTKFHFVSSRNLSPIQSVHVNSVLYMMNTRNLLDLRYTVLLAPHAKSYARASSKTSHQKHPFEVDSNVLKDTLLFEYKDDRFYKLLTIFGLVQFFFWIYLSGLAYQGLGNFKAENLPEKAKKTFWGQLLLMQGKYKHKIAFITLILGNLILAVSTLLPLRTISRLHLLKGGKKVKIETYTHFGQKRAFVVPLESVSCNQSRVTKAPQISMKVKDKLFYFQMDNNKGRFFSTDIYDYVVGIKRKW